MTEAHLNADASFLFRSPFQRRPELRPGRYSPRGTSGQQPLGYAGDAAPMTRPSPAQTLQTVRLALAGDPAAGTQIAERLRAVARMLYVINRRKGGLLNDGDLEDLAADVTLLVWRKLGNYEGLGALESWVYRFCELEHGNRLRRTRGRVTVAMEEAPEPATEDRDDQDSEAIEAALVDLGPPEEDLVRLKHFEDLSFTEIGQRIGLSTSTVKTRYYRGLQALRARLAPQQRENR